MFKEVLNIPYEVFTTLPAAESSIHINYSAKNAGSSRTKYIPVSGFLRDFSVGGIDCQVVGGGSAFRMFVNKSEDDFDIFAMIFYFLSRYEEYFISETDQAGRITFENFTCVKNKFHDIPLIDTLIVDFYERLRTEFTELPVFCPQISILAGIDIDFMYLHAYKDPVRFVGSLVRSAFKGNMKSFISILKSKSANFTDPYAKYEEWMSPLENMATTVNIFILTAMKRQGNDKNFNPSHPAFKAWLSGLSNKYRIDYQWHPSLQSNHSFEILSAEKAFLEKIAERKIIKSRQHFLYFSLPVTYRNLLRLGIKEEHSMGFYDRTGYRSSTAYPHQWYDLTAEKQTELRIYPFVAMDVQLLKYMKLDADKAVELISEIKRRQRNTGGIFSFIWHNSSFLEADGWKGWEKVYLEMLR